MKLKELKEIFQEEEEGKIILPNFQRDFVWDEKQQKELLATFLVELPISSILLLKGNPNDFNYRKLCFKDEGVGAKEDCLYLLDGQQRMSTLKSIFYNFFDENWENNFNKLYGKLKNMWFIKVKRVGEETEDIFGYENLEFKDENLRKFTPQEVIDNIEVFKVNKTKKTDWFHPINIIGDGHCFAYPKREFINKCTKECLVPLNGLVKDKGLQEKILEKIAEERIDEVISEIENEKDLEKKKEKISKYFVGEFKECLLENIENCGNCANKFKYKITSFWQTKVITFLENLLKQEISLIEIQKNEISRGIAIFETINKGGTPLDNFDLIVAKAAKDSTKLALAQRIRNYLQIDIDLPEFLQIGNRKKWNANKMNLTSKNADEISKRIKNQYLNLLSIFYHTGENFEKLKLEIIKRDKIFEVETDGINKLTEKVIKSLLRALAFCNLRLGILELGDISFDLILLPIAYLLDKDEIWNDEKSLNKIEYWYWVSIFTGRYREKQNTRVVEDLKMLADWILLKDKNNEKVKELLEEKIKKVLKVEDYSDLKTLKNNSQTHSALSKGILAYVLSTNPFDLLTNQQRRLYDEVIIKANLKLEDHHLIPVGGDKKIGGDLSSTIRNDKKHILNSVLNLTKISKEANGKISNMKLDEYIAQVDEVCRISHFIPKNLDKKPDENIEAYYERLIKDRYDNIRDALIKELHELKK